MAMTLVLGVGLWADTLIFHNGDVLSGTLVRADAAVCIFHSDQAGTVTVPWANVRQLHTEKTYIVVASDGHIYNGQLIVDGGTMEIASLTSTQPWFVPPAAIRMVVDPKTYKQAVTAHPLPWQSWRGLISGGFSQVSATQSSTSYTTRLDLDRPVPTLSWLPQRSDTLLHFQGTYGKLSQPGKPLVRTSIFTGGLEQDQDLSKRLFLFGNAQYDHNLAQGLQLQQAYGGGLGWKLLDSAASILDLKADVHWTHQRFLTPSVDAFLASSFTESLRENYGRVVWNESVSLTPSYTRGLAYQMSGVSSWAVPVYKSISLNFTAVDSYLHNPQPGFLRNSLQFSTGLQVNIR